MPGATRDIAKRTWRGPSRFPSRPIGLMSEVLNAPPPRRRRRSPASWASHGRSSMSNLELRPCSFAMARDFVGLYHRHNKPPVGHKFSVACYEGDRLCGVCMVGRPVSRYLDDGVTLEVNRCCTDGTKNACSMLYGAACRAAKALGYKRIVTYTRESEPGTSLRASNWRCDGMAGGTHWTGKRYDQLEMQLDEMKIRWSKDL